MKQLQNLSREAQGDSIVKRTFTGIALVVIIGFAVLSGEVGFVLLLVTIHLLAMTEYQKLVDPGHTYMQKITAQILGLLLMLLCWGVIKGLLPPPILLIAILFPPVLSIVELFRRKPHPFQNIALTVLGLAWISFPLSAFLSVGFLSYEFAVYRPFLVLGCFIILWMGDSGAFFIGKLIGKHYLFKRISPKKTWEGSIGGFLAAGLAGFLNFILFEGLLLSQWLLLALIINLAGSFGDLTKSMLKRSAGVKDSGNILPGHGGILDRFDSLMGSAPFVLVYLIFYA